LYEEHKDIEDVYLVVNEEYLNDVSNELSYYNKLKIVGIKNTKSVLETLNYVLNEMTLNENLIINVATTIPSRVISDNSVLLDSSIRENIAWSGIKINNHEKVFIYKNKNIEFCHAFTGLFRMNKDKIQNAMNNIVDKLDLLYLIRELCILEKEISFVFDDWIDCGHEINYYDAKSKLISSRTFNSIKINNIEGTIEKSSTNINKFIDEINYISLLPMEIKVLFPIIYSEPIKSNNSITTKMEYYGYPTLAEYMLHWNLKDFSWERIFDVLFYIMDKFTSHSYSIGVNAFKKFYLEKHYERLNLFQLQLRNNVKLSQILFDDSIYINNKNYKNI
jgi:hypothetical protein